MEQIKGGPHAFLLMSFWLQSPLNPLPRCRSTFLVSLLVFLLSVCRYSLYRVTGRKVWGLRIYMKYNYMV
jgi:hypothetical protein